MLRTQNKIKFLLQYSRLVKVMFFVICGLFFTTANANLPHINNQNNCLRDKDYYFLDIDGLQLSSNLGDLDLIYPEKEGPNTSWIVIPIKSSMRDYYTTVANVVAAELHRRIDKDSVVPCVKFVIGESMDGHGGYQLFGSAYKEMTSSSKSIRKVMNEENLDDYTNAIYQNNNVERNRAIWNYLGLGSPDPASEILKDGRIIRYDYHDSFQYNGDTEYYEKCFCTSYYPISDYRCSIDYIKNFEKELRNKHKDTFVEIVSEIRAYVRGCLEEGDLREVNQALDDIKSNAGF